MSREIFKSQNLHLKNLDAQLYLIFHRIIQVIDKRRRIEKPPNGERSVLYPQLLSLLSRVAEERTKKLGIRVLGELDLKANFVTLRSKVECDSKLCMTRVNYYTSQLLNASECIRNTFAWQNLHVRDKLTISESCT